MKEQLFENYNKITKIRSSIHNRIESDDVKEHLLLVINNVFLESQNIQLLLNLQLQAKTIAKYDKYFRYISQNGTADDDEIDEGELNEEEEEEEDEPESDPEEEKIETQNELKTSQPAKSSSPERSNAQTDNKANGGKGTKGKAGVNIKKSTLLSNPYFKKNPYLAQQSKNKKKYK